jgi:hypothetical protein
MPKQKHGAPGPVTVLLQDLRAGDRFTDDDVEWEAG